MLIFEKIPNFQKFSGHSHAKNLLDFNLPLKRQDALSNTFHPNFNPSFVKSDNL